MSKVVFDADKVRKTITLPLASVPGSELEFYTDNILGVERELAAKYPKYQDKEHQDSFSFVIETLGRMLKSWNLTDKNNEDIPVSEAINIFNQVPGSDILKIIAQIEETKKNSIGASGEQGLVQS